METEGGQGSLNLLFKVCKILLLTYAIANYTLVLISR